MCGFGLNDAQRSFLVKTKVQAIYLFGSRAQKKEGPLSDYDYALLLKEKGHKRGDDLYFKFYDFFSEISPRTLKNDTIDIIYLRDVGLELCFHVIRYGLVIYDNDPKARLHFETTTHLLYCDYRPILDQFDHTILRAL